MSWHYLMEDPREASRLAAKVDPDRWVQAHLTDLMRPGDHVLDVGCGPGTVAAAAAQACAGTHVVAMDLSAERAVAYRAAIGASTLRLMAGDAATLPFRDESFDLSYCRLLLEYLPQRERTVREIVRVTRVGGTVLLYDLDGQLVWHDPEEPAITAVMGKVLGALRGTGFDPHAGRRLFRLAYRAGLTDLRVAVEPYHLIAGSIDPTERRRWQLKLDIATPAIAEALGSPDAAKDAIEAFLAFLDRPDTLTYSVAFTVVGHRRPPASQLHQKRGAS